MADDNTPSFDDLASDLAGDVNSEPVEQQDTTAEDSSTEDNKSPEVVEPAAETEDDADTEDSEAKESDEQDESDETQAEEQPLGKAEERKQSLNSDIRDLVTQRNELRNEVERLNSQVYAPQTVEDIMDETGQSQADARITAMEQRQELAEYNNQVAEAQLVLSSESERVLNDFPMFNPNSPDYREEVATQAANLLRSNLQIDPNTGQIIGSHVSPYQLYQTIASANQAAAVENQIKGQRSTEQMLANAEPQSSAVPKQPAEDPFLAGLTKGYGDRLGT